MELAAPEKRPRCPYPGRIDWTVRLNRREKGSHGRHRAPPSGAVPQSVARDRLQRLGARLRRRRLPLPLRKPRVPAAGRETALQASEAGRASPPRERPLSPREPVAASPFSPPDADQPMPAATSLAEWLRGRTDRQLTLLLRLRPDLVLPAPPDLAALAGRVAVRTSAQRAVDNLDAFSLAALENLVLLAGNGDAVEQPPAAALETLLDLALVWGDTRRVHLVPTVRDAVGAYPAGLGRPAAALLASVPDVQLVPVLRHLGIPPTAQPRAGAAVAEVLADRERVAALVAGADDAERDVLDRLAAGPPVGTVRSTRLAPDAAELSPPHRLLHPGPPVPPDTQPGELPRGGGRVLRTLNQSTPTAPEPPGLNTVQREPADLDRLAT